jgi:hypothetical protein
MQCETVNLTLRDHQKSTPSWDFNAVVSELHVWAERMILEFKLEIPVPCLLIEGLKRRYGHFRPGRNGFGLKDEIGMDEGHVRHSPFWRVCGTLLHELLHEWQDYHGRRGRRNYHNKQFRKKAASLGLIIDQRGFTQYSPGDSAFFSLLKRYGIQAPELPKIQDQSVQRRGSKLKLYECLCGVKVRVGRSRFRAQCLDCDGVFVLQGENAESPESTLQKSSQ